MKKLAAGVFTGVLTIVTLNVAHADVPTVATTTWVRNVIGTLNGDVDGDDGVVKTIEQVDGKITATRALITGDDIARGAISTENIDGLDGALAEKQTTANIVNSNEDDGFDADDYNSTTKYPSMLATQKIASRVVSERINDVDAGVIALQKNIDGLNADEVTGIIKKISQTKGIVSATAGQVSKSDLDANLAKEISDNTAAIATLAGISDGSVFQQIQDVIDSTTIEKDGNYIKKENNIAENLSELDKQVKNNTDAITELTGDGDGSIKTLQNSITQINQTVEGKVNAVDLNNKLLTTDTTGQLVDAATTNVTGSCTPDADNGITCMLVNNGNGFRWETIVDKYTSSAN